jgi:putative membrane protein
MRKILCNSLLVGAVSLAALGASLAYPQAPGPGSQPSQRPSTTSEPGMGNPSAGTPETMPVKQVDDKKFVKDAAIGGLTEVELGKLAAQKASSDGVKQFGQKMVDDHNKANEELKEIASKANIEIPASLDSKHQSRLDKLAKLSGPEFDKAYVKDQLKDHQKDVSEFQNEAQSGSDPNVRQFANKTLPTLQEHLSMVKDLNKKSKEASK